MNSLAGGAIETQEFYEELGWTRQDGKLLDTDLFGVKEDGPIRQVGHRVRSQRIRDAVKSAGDHVRLLECGCGGTPATFLADLCAHFTAVDFSARGLEEAAKALAKTGVAHDTQVADICKLAFPADSFDAVYSAHALYHIPDASAQAAAIGEMLRVVRPGGVVVLVVANPRPLLSPLRMLKRIIADTPILSSVATKLRPPPPLPYKPMTIGWTKRQFRGKAEVEVISYAIASTWVNQHVSEQTFVGSHIWKSMIHLEANRPRLSAHIGNYITVIARRH